MHGKEAELLMAGFVYVARCLAEGDTATLRRMGLGGPDLRALSRLGLSDVLRLVRRAATAPFLEIRFDRAAFQRQLERLEAQRQAEDRLLALLQGDAPQAMLHDLFGTTLKGRCSTTCSARPSRSTTAIAGCSAWDPAPSGGPAPPTTQPCAPCGRPGRRTGWIGYRRVRSRNTIWRSTGPRGFPCARSGPWRASGPLIAPHALRPLAPRGVAGL